MSIIVSFVVYNLNTLQKKEKHMPRGMGRDNPGRGMGRDNPGKSLVHWLY
jgi:hypothetical protein